jgi:hypothetical protein
MSGAIHPDPQYAFMVWCLVNTGTTLPLPWNKDENTGKDISLPKNYCLNRIRETGLQIARVDNSTILR